MIVVLEPMVVREGPIWSVQPLMKTRFRRLVKMTTFILMIHRDCHRRTNTDHRRHNERRVNNNNNSRRVGHRVILDSTVRGVRQNKALVLLRTQRMVGDWMGCKIQVVCHPRGNERIREPRYSLVILEALLLVVVVVVMLVATRTMEGKGTLLESLPGMISKESTMHTYHVFVYVCVGGGGDYMNVDTWKRSIVAVTLFALCSVFHLLPFM